MPCRLPLTVAQGTNQLIGTDPAKIIAAAHAILAGVGKPGRIATFWDGHAAARIVDVLFKNPPLGPHRKSTLPVT